LSPQRRVLQEAPSMVLSESRGMALHVTTGICEGAGWQVQGVKPL